MIFPIPPFSPRPVRLSAASLRGIRADGQADYTGRVCHPKFSDFGGAGTPRITRFEFQHQGMRLRRLRQYDAYPNGASISNFSPEFHGSVHRQPCQLLRRPCAEPRNFLIIVDVRRTLHVSSAAAHSVAWCVRRDHTRTELFWRCERLRRDTCRSPAGYNIVWACLNLVATADQLVPVNGFKGIAAASTRSTPSGKCVTSDFSNSNQLRIRHVAVETRPLRSPTFEVVYVGTTATHDTAHVLPNIAGSVQRESFCWPPERTSNRSGSRSPAAAFDQYGIPRFDLRFRYTLLEPQLLGARRFVYPLKVVGRMCS